MNDDKGGHTGNRLWGDDKEKGRREPEARQPAQRPADQQRRAGDNVLPLVRPDRVYAPFEFPENSNRLHIHCATQPSHFPLYSTLVDIIYDHDFESAITLVFSFMTVKLTGQNLGPVVHAMFMGQCGRIREYHSKLYDPVARGTPVIQKIEIVTGRDEKDENAAKRS
jgi:hypothetical protein